MSAIAGISFFDGRPSDHGLVACMMERLAHRGEADGVWSGASTMLGCRRQKGTFDVDEPMLRLSPDGMVAIVADARIDNREELRSLLGIASSEAPLGDASLILNMYLRWGVEAIEKLDGDFAIAIWDGHRQELVLARDRFGVKPLYYCSSDESVIFASEIKALFCQPERARRLNMTRVADYLIPLFEDQTITFYEGVHRLPPAHVLTARRGQLTIDRYWSLDPTCELRRGDDRQYAEEFRRLFVEAVRCRMRGERVGSLLSGGLDSSSIASVARNILQQEGKSLDTFSAIFDELPQCDEREYIQAVIDGGGITPHFVHADRIDPFVDVDRVLWHMDEASFAPNLFIHWELYRQARAAGVTVLLDGLDGDSTVSHGRAYLTELARSGRMIEFWRAASAFSANGRIPMGKILYKRGLRPLVPKALRRGIRSLGGGSVEAMPIDSAVRRDFARDMGMEARVRELMAGRDSLALTAREDHYRQISSGIQQYVLESADRASAGFGVEARYPFFDHRLVEYCLALPGDQKLSDGWSRGVLRRGMEGILPPAIQWRPGKVDLSHNYNRSLHRYSIGRIEEVVIRQPELIDRYFDIDTLRSVFNRYKREGRLADALTLWKATTLGLWLRQSGLGGA